jgi:hypothetical protein
MKALLTYLRYRLSHPQQNDFVSMGLGIMARYRRCSSFWNSHLEASRAFINSSLASLPERGGKVLILGAGRLLDVDINKILAKVDQVELWDYDIAAVEHLNNVFANKRRCLTTKCCDMTACLEEWTHILRKSVIAARRSDFILLRELLCNSLQSLKAPPVVFEADIIISLNVLGQLRIYWVDRVEQILRQFLSNSRSNSLLADPQFYDVLRSTEIFLERQHTRALEMSRSRMIVLLADRYLHYYKREHSSWITTEALAADFPDTLQNFRTVKRESWFWHIVPHRLEDKNYGIIHDVFARCYTRLE